jgi:hypothetical protein
MDQQQIDVVFPSKKASTQFWATSFSQASNLLKPWQMRLVKPVKQVAASHLLRPSAS